MKPAAFDYERPPTLDEATGLLGDTGVFSRAIAGGQSLGPILNLRLAQPQLLVDISAIPELRAASDERDYVDIGACIAHADVEDGRIPDASRGLLPFVARGIAYRAMRNRGTLGGSLAHADPAADWISVLPLLGAEVMVHSRRGSRTVEAAKPMASSFVTVLERNEIIWAIRVPKLSARARWGFFKFNQKVGEFAHAIGAVLHDPQRSRFRAVIGAVETAPIVLSDAASLFGGPFRADLGNHLDQRPVLELLDAKGVSDEYNRQLALVALKRAAMQASQT